VVVRPKEDFVGSYRLLGLAGTGRTVQVWEAVHQTDGTRAALKMILPEHANNAEQLALMKQEFLTGQKLNHPRVIRVFEFNKHRGLAYLALEFFGGQNLKQLLLQKNDDFQKLLPKIAIQAAEGLAYFHSQGWIHRDVKPDNFLVTPEGDVKLIDFALATRKPSFFGRLMGSKKIQGTRSYMSPEQIRGEALDPRADIYSFGCMLFELFGGRPPFTGQTTNDLLNKHLRAGPPPLESMNRLVTPEFAELVRATLAKKPAARPESMNLVLDTLRRIRILNLPQRPQTS
jgi:serine/threonine protein kinase